MIKIKIGDLDVYHKGSLVNPTGDNLEITMGSHSDFTAEFEFKKDSNNEDTRIEAFQIERTGIGLRFINFNNTLGTGNVTPLRVGWLEGRSIFLNYRVYPINSEEGYILEYTWLLGKKVDENGKEIE
ncbi:DUF6864 domain-containing function [uncultured Dokdonia sp.]|uniref:DUF6864 domain-containing function n=1 Tax=uncultured Dokdonia sp. TaxID=575653 RepID=UPI002611032E|nr:hypothetical protein [uncultured Dokdonia sp.]